MSYAFLSKPPQKTRPAPTIPLPSPPATQTTAATPALRRRSSTFSAIAAWAQTVQPGTPAPLSPHRRRRSISRRRPSIGHTKSNSSGVGSFLTISTPTTASKSPLSPKFDENPKTAAEPAFDLTELGYATMFVNLPYTPATPAQFASRPAPPTYENIAVPPIPASPVKPAKGLKRFRSLTILKPIRGNSSKTPSPVSPTRSTVSKDTKVAKKSKKEPKAKSSHPPTLQNELMLMQFMDGGSIDSHIKTTMTRRAKEQAPAKSSQAKSAAVDTVWRDEHGMVWMDEDERVERAALLVPMDNWMSFERRGSETLTISGCSDIFSGQGRVDVASGEDTSLFGVGMTLRIPFAPSASTEKEKKIRKIPPPLNLTPPPRTGFVFEDSFAPAVKHL